MPAIDVNTKAFLFDVFGTCVDWRTSVTNALYEACDKKLSNPTTSVSPAVRQKASQLGRQGWGDFAQEWRQTYYDFTRGLAKDPTATFKTVDQHHLDSLRDLLRSHGLVEAKGKTSSGDLWDDSEIKHISTVWHRLDSWPDTNKGLDILSKTYTTATLSNANTSLLKNMQEHSGMRFTQTFSSELFETYKPNPAIYKGAAEKLGLDVGQCVMVAAHLGDLEAAKGVGMQTAYVERPQEERMDPDEARRMGFVDVWIQEGEDGFLGLCRLIGLEVN